MIQFLLMRHEISLLLIFVILLVWEIFSGDKQRQAGIYFALALFAVHTLVGFLPMDEGSLFGGSFHTSGMIHLFKNVLNAGVLIVLLQSMDWLKDKVVHYRKTNEFFLLLFASLMGMYYMVSAGEFLMFYLGLELSTLPLIGLVAYHTYSFKGTEAAVKLILSAALASGTSLFGLSMLYATGGDLTFAGMASNLKFSPLAVMGLAFMFSGIGFKISLAPFHFWTADVYEGAPTGITSYLSVISKASAVFILMTLLFTVFPVLTPWWRYMVWWVAVLTMFVGNLFALRQQNMKRFLAFSSVAQAGFMMMGIINADTLGYTSVVYFLLIYIFSNLGAFGVVQAIENETGKVNMEDYTGLYRTNPKLSLVLLLSLFSLAGIPPLAGFFGKFFLYTAAAQKGYYLLVFLGVVNVTISLYYYLLPVRAMFLRKSENPIPHFESRPGMRIALVIIVVGLLLLGLFSPLYEYISELSTRIL